MSLSPKVLGPGFRGIFERAFLQLAGLRSSPKSASQRGNLNIKGFPTCPDVMLVFSDAGGCRFGRGSSAAEHTTGAKTIMLARNTKKDDMLQRSIKSDAYLLPYQDVR